MGVYIDEILAEYYKANRLTQDIVQDQDLMDFFDKKASAVLTVLENNASIGFQNWSLLDQLEVSCVILDGIRDALHEGYITCHPKHSSAYYDEGYNDGWNEGHSEGYEEGWDSGQNCED